MTNEHLTNDEALSAVASLYNNQNMSVTNLKITGKLEVIDPVTKQSVTITPGSINLTNKLILEDLSNNTLLTPTTLNTTNIIIKDLSNNQTTIKPGSIDTNLYIACTGKGLNTDAPNMTTTILPYQIKCTDSGNWYWTLTGDNRNRTAALDLNNWQIRQGPLGSKLDGNQLRIYNRDHWYDDQPFDRKMLTELWSEKGSNNVVHAGYMLRRGNAGVEGQFRTNEGRHDRGYIQGSVWVHKTNGPDWWA